MSTHPASRTPSSDDLSSKFTNLSKDDVIIAVVGVTGAGKSTFIEQCCGGTVKIAGHNLFSFTQECNSYSFNLDDKTTVQLVDTPGFDDTSRTDDQVLRQLASWLSFAYQKGFRLNGMVYLQTIGEPRVKGSHLTNLRMFQEMTGLDNMESVVLTTTMWDKTDRESAKKRELQLMQEDKFWQPMIKRKSHVMRFMNDQESALNIIRILVDKHKMVPKLQHEMNVEGKDLDQTNAGRAVNKRLIEQKEQHEQEKKELTKQMEKALKENDMKYTQELLDAQETNTKQMKQLEHAQQDLKVSNERLLKEKEEQIEHARQEMEKLRENVEQQGKEYAVEIEKRNDKEKEMKENMEQLARNTETYKEQLVEGAAAFVVEMNDAYKGIIQDQESKNKQLLAKMQEVRLGPPPQYPGLDLPYQQAPAPPPMPVYQPMPQAMYQPSPQADTAMMGAMGGSLMALVATGAVACIVM